MSDQPPVPTHDRRAPIRKATATKMSASGPEDRIASSRDIAIYFREDCRTLRDSLQLEMVVAQYWLRIRDVRSSTGVPVGDAAGAGIVAELEGAGDPLSRAILLGLADLGVGDTARRSGEAAARLAERGVGLPPEFEDLGEVRALHAWRATAGGRRGEYVLFAELEHPRGARHTLALFVEPRGGGSVKHIGLLTAMRELDPGGPFDPERMERLAIPEAGGLMREVLERSYGRDLAGSDDHRVPIAAARARAMVAT
jgi:hypothetical protein